MSVKVEKLEEQWTSTTVQAAFTFHLTSPKSGDFSIDLSLLNLGWIFALSFSGSARRGVKRTRITKTYDWIPVTFSFRQYGGSNPWGDTSLQAQLTIDSADTISTHDAECTTQNDTNDSPMPIGTLQVVLSRNRSVVLPLKTAGFLSLQHPTKIWLNVTISGCPFSDGLFRTNYADPVSEAEAHTRLVRQCGDRLLTRSLATGKLFDVKFLTSSTRTEKLEKLRPTYASLLVLEQKIDLPSSKLGDEWKCALSALKGNDEADIKHTAEVLLCPDGYEHELDSDLDDEDSDEVSSIEESCALPPTEGGPSSIRRDHEPRSDCGSESSNSSISSFELYQPEEIIMQGSAETHHIADDNKHRAFLVKFAAHRTWRAFLWYCYTGQVEFNHLKSQVEHGVRHPDIEAGPPPCSPKSMYRLADLVGNKDLKDKALTAISERMNEKNILEETFSVFTSKYPDVRQAQMSILLKHMGSPEVKGAFVNVMKNFVNMPHAEPVLLALCDRLVRG